jgi:hypothetical protein
MVMADQLPAIIEPDALTPLPADTHLVPALIAAAGEQVRRRYVEFFTANIRTRAAPTPARAAGSSPGARIAAWR